jgi:hypothetical protein
LKKEKGMVWNDADGGITYYKTVNVVFTRMAVARLVAPTSPIWLLRRLERNPTEHPTINPR